MRSILLILASVILFLLNSCTIKEVEVGNIESVSIKDVTKKQITLELGVPIKNNNNFSFTISKANLNLSLNNVELGKIKKSSKLKIPANSNKVHFFTVSIEFNKLTENPLGLLSSLITNKVGLKASGYIKARKFIYCKKFDIDENQSVKLFKKGLFN